jgi:protein-tyrosine phosphatase
MNRNHTVSFWYNDPMTNRLSFVCLGNICRSPLAEGVFRRLVDNAGLGAAYEIESAGVGPWHVGEAPDPRSQHIARAHGLSLDSIAQQITARDFARLDLILALDGEVADSLHRLAPTAADRAKVRLLREFDPQANPHNGRANLDVPDPYYGGPDGFEAAFQMIERSARGLLAHLQGQPRA